MTLKQIFGKNVKYYRFLRKMTQEKFAEKVNLNASYVSELENGKYGPTFEKIEEIAKVLNVKVYNLSILLLDKLLYSSNSFLYS